MPCGALAPVCETYRSGPESCFRAAQAVRDDRHGGRVPFSPGTNGSAADGWRRSGQESLRARTVTGHAANGGQSPDQDTEVGQGGAGSHHVGQVHVRAPSRGPPLTRVTTRRDDRHHPGSRSQTGHPESHRHSFHPGCTQPPDLLPRRHRLTVLSANIGGHVPAETAETTTGQISRRRLGPRPDTRPPPPEHHRGGVAVLRRGLAGQLALETASGPVAASRSRARGSEGIRTATVPWISPSSHSIDGW